ncbi:MAG: DUF11 domain-containing protein [Phycisphaerales bacterium]
MAASGAGYTPNIPPDMNASMMYLPTGDPATSGLQVWQLMPKQVRANQTFTHEVHVHNMGNAPLSDVIVADKSTKNLTIVDSTPKAMQGPGGGYAWDLGEFGPHETKVIKITSKSGSVGEAGNCLVADYNNHHCAVTEVVDPRLEITKNAPAEVSICDNIPLSFTVKNAGSGNLANVTVSDQLPSGLTVNGQSALTLPVGPLAQGESKTVTASAKADKTGRYDNTATASADGNITATSNKTSTMVKQPKLVVTCEPTPAGYINQQVGFKYTVKNVGDFPCNSTQLTVALPPNAQFVSASNNVSPAGGSIKWDLGTLPPGGTATANVVLSAKDIGQLNCSATATCGCAEPNATNCSVEVKGIPAVLLECIDINDPLEVGKETTYVITVTNQGSVTLTNVKINCALPREELFSSAGGATSTTSTGSTISFAPLASLPVGGKAEWRVVAKATAPGEILFKITMKCDQIISTVEETESTNLYK